MKQQQSTEPTAGKYSVHHLPDPEADHGDGGDPEHYLDLERLLIAFIGHQHSGKRDDPIEDVLFLRRIYETMASGTCGLDARHHSGHHFLLYCTT